jgi:hydroxyacylglutathione hydrolase
MFKVHTVYAFSDNFIWLIQNETSSAVAIVDPGDASPVLDALQQLQLDPAAILITHHHGDHIGGVRRLLQHHDVPVYGPAQENIPGLTHPLKDGDVIQLDMLPAEFRVLDVPGHTRGHIAYVGHGMLFCGDTLFSVGCGRLFEGTAEQMYDSLEKIRALPDDTRVYCAHEYTLDNIRFAKVVEPDNPDLLAREAEAHEQLSAGGNTVPSLLGVEKRTNPFLRSHESTVIRAAEGFAGHALPRASEVFGTVRNWKDTLD